MEQARNITRFERDRAAAAPSLSPDDASFVDALLALPPAIPADAVDRAMTQQQLAALARRLRDVIDKPARLAG
jgi:hypothetical protein